MKNKFFKFLFLGAIIAFMCTFGACKKDADTMAIITVIDVNGDVVKDARVRLHQDGQISQAGASSIISDEQWTDASGKTEHVFEHEAILNIDVSKWVGTNELTGSNVIRLLKHKTVSKTIEID